MDEEPLNNVRSMTWKSHCGRRLLRYWHEQMHQANVVRQQQQQQQQQQHELLARGNHFIACHRLNTVHRGCLSSSNLCLAHMCCRLKWRYIHDDKPSYANWRK